MSKMKYSEKIMLLRKEKGFTQEELAYKLGVTRQAVSRWEAGETAPDMASIVKLCEVFGVSADYLIREDCERESPAATPAPQKKTHELHLLSGGCFAFAAFCAIVGILTHTTDAQLVVSVILAILFAANAAAQFYLYFGKQKR